MTGKRNARVIRLILAAAFVLVLNETIMGVAIPHLVIDLGITITAAQWLTTAFMLTMAVVIPVTGFLLQRFATRPIFITAMSLFSGGTLIAALAPGVELLMVARVVQACGTAIILPLLITTLMTLVAPADRGRFMGRVAIVISVAPAVGPTISGLILTYLSWRYLFWLVFPIAVAMLVIGIRRVENVSEPQRSRLDLLSVILSAFGFGGLVYGLTLVGGVVTGTDDAAVMWVTLTLGLVGVAAFVLRQLFLQRRDQALLDLRTFRSPAFSIAVGLMVVVMTVLFGMAILLPIYLQDVLHLEPAFTGLLLLPGSLLMGLLGPVVGRLYDRFGPTPLVVPGSVIISGVLWSLTLVTETTASWTLLASFVALSAGLAFMFTPLSTSALGSVGPRLYAHGAALMGTVQQVAGAAGTALFVTIMTAATTSAATTATTPEAAQAAGVRQAFLVGAIVSTVAIAGACFVRRPPGTGADGPASQGGQSMRQETEPAPVVA